MTNIIKSLIQFQFVDNENEFPPHADPRAPLNLLCISNLLLYIISVHLGIIGLQRLHKLSYLHLFTDCFMKITLQSLEQIIGIIGL